MARFSIHPAAVVVLGMVALCATPTWLRAEDEKAAFRRMVAEQRRMMENPRQNMPSLGKKSWSELFEMRVDADRLTLQTRLSSQNRSSRVEIKETGNIGTLSMSGGSKDGQPVTPNFFYLNIQDYSDPDATANLMISSRPESFQVSSNRNTVSGFRNLSFVQTRSAMNGRNSMVSFTLIEGSRNGVQTRVNVRESNFLAFRRKHPRETNLYLRPLMHLIGQDSVFLIDPMLLAQVFIEDWPADPTTREEVVRRLPALDSDDYLTRDRATTEIRQFGREAAVAMLHLDRTNLSMEQNLRLNVLLAEYTLLSGSEAAALRNDPDFLLDCLCCEDAHARKISLMRLEKVLNRAIELPPESEPQARAQAIATLRKEVHPTPTSAPAVSAPVSSTPGKS